MWFLFTILTLLAWGTGDIFYKKGAREDEKYSHLKISMFVGIVMGIQAIYMIFFGNINYDPINIIKYFPASLAYILSMTVGYFGLRYLEVSIASPIENSSGALACILGAIFLHEEFNAISITAVVLITVGIIALGFLEKDEEDEYEKKNKKKYKIGFIAFLMPIIYCIFDAIGTILDIFYLDIENSPLVNVTEGTITDVANTSYELTFLLFAILIFVYVRLIKKEKIGIKKQGAKIGASICETVGQYTYLYALFFASENGTIASAAISAYSIVTIILSRIFLKEKLTWKQYASIAVVMVGIIMLGVLDV